MFYVKSRNTDGTETATEVTTENVFTRCSDCGTEMAVDLGDMVLDGELDLYGTECRCVSCAYKHALKHRGEEWAEVVIHDYELGHGHSTITAPSPIEL